MSSWTLVHSSPTQGRIFTRPLDVPELGFHWDGLFNGTVDNLQHFQLRLLNGLQDARLFSNSNIIRAWLSTKRRYPLAGASVDVGIPDPNGHLESEPRFVVRENDLRRLHPDEITFGSVSSAEEAQKRASAIINGPRPLSIDLLAKLYVFRESEGTDVLHLFTLMGHCITDGIATITFIRCLLDTLASGSEPPIPSLEERLSMEVGSRDLEPAHLKSLSVARRRWRRAIGFVIFQLRQAKRQGGHTLPCRLKHSTSPARSCFLYTHLTHEQTASVIANCRLLDLTFGNAYLPLAQVAMTRVLYRRYLRGDISEDEWEYRKRQPHISGGPLNLRPYLDEQWFNNGGAGEFMLSISFFFYQLPFMTLGTTSDLHRRNELVLSDGAPPFLELLTFERFLHRADSVKRQAAEFLRHPLFHEIAGAADTARLECTRSNVLQWMRSVEERLEGVKGDEDVLAATDSIPAIWAHGGSSIGNLDMISPTEYPLPPTHPLSPRSSTSHPLRAGYTASPSPSLDSVKPKFVVEYSRVHLHARPAQLYLGAATSRGRLTMYAFYDGNVFEDQMVQEWLDEVREAVVWYLGQTHHSSRDGPAKDGAASKARLEAKL